MQDGMQGFIIVLENAKNGTQRNEYVQNHVMLVCAETISNGKAYKAQDHGRGRLGFALLTRYKNFPTYLHPHIENIIVASLNKMLPVAVFPPALLALGLLTRNISAQEYRNLSDHSVGPFPVFSKIPPIGAADPYIIETFTQKLSLYCIAIDTKTFSALSGVFTHNVVANVAPSPITSLAEYETFLEADLRGFKT